MSTALADLDEQERYALFDRLQERMPHAWSVIRMNLPGESVVVVPSVTLDRINQASGTLTQAMEERFLFLLLLLREPRLRMIYVTSTPISPGIVEYYLALLPGVVPSHARERLTLISADDASPRPLSEKLLERPSLMRRIADLIPDRSLSHLIPYNTTTLERDVALVLGIPMYGADPRLFELGTKSGSRRIFADVGVAHPAGTEDLHSLEDLHAATIALRAARPDMTSAIVKLNEGVSGAGNALVDLHGLPPSGSPGEATAVYDRLQAMTFELESTPFDAYLAKFSERGGIIEERVQGDDVRSPSVQLRVLPDGTIELLSTHDQLLGGPSGQSYLGCRFPADSAYSQEIGRAALTIGERLRDEGVLGRFAVDFLAVRIGDDWECYAIEINLRKGGTTHPFLTLQFLTDGAYDVSAGRFFTADGHEKHLVATDHLESPLLRALSQRDLFDVVARHGLHFDPVRQAGVVFHMISCLTECGRLGLTAVADTPQEADSLYENAQRILLEEAQAASRGVRVSAID